MDCTDLATLLSGLIDDELDAPTRHAAERHLVDCPRCGAIVARAEQLDTRLRLSAGAWGRDDPMPEAIIDSVLRRTVGDTRPLRRARRQATFGWLAAAAALGLAATAWFADRSGLARERGTAPPSRESVSGSASAPGNVTASTPDRPGSVRNNGGGSNLLATGSAAAGRSEPFDAPSDDESDDAIAAFLHGPPIALAMAVSVDGEATPMDGEAAHGDSPRWDGDGAEVVEADLSEPLDSATMDADLREEDADALASAAVLLRQLVEAGSDSFADAERLREIVEYDGLVDRLGEAHEHLRGDDRAACWSAESVLLRLQRGPLSQDDLRRMQQDVQRLELPTRLERASRRMEERRPA